MRFPFASFVPSSRVRRAGVPSADKKITLHRYRTNSTPNTGCAGRTHAKNVFYTNHHVPCTVVRSPSTVLFGFFYSTTFEIRRRYTYSKFCDSRATGDEYKKGGRGICERSASVNLECLEDDDGGGDGDKRPWDLLPCRV